MGLQAQIDDVNEHAQRSGGKRASIACNKKRDTKAEANHWMDRQVERSLFGNDFETQQEAQHWGDERRMGQRDPELANQPEKENADKNAKVTIEGLRQILIRQDYRCALSGVVLSPECASLDHIHPLVKGGCHVLSNIQIVHPVVNRLKGSMTQSELVQWAKLIASHVNDD